MVVNIYQTISYTYGSDLYLRPYGRRSMSQTPMTGALCLRPLWLAPYVSDPYGLRPMYQTPMSQKPKAGDLCLRHLWLETYVSDTYGWRPTSQTPMAGDLCLRNLCVSDNHKLIDRLISYALYVVLWNYASFPIQ
jgi:hypothetical protein